MNNLSVDISERCCAEYPECTHILYWYEGFKEGLKHPGMRFIASAVVGQWSEEQLKAFRRYVEWCGPIHARNCPADDTCDCEWKETLDVINAALRLA